MFGSFTNNYKQQQLRNKLKYSIDKNKLFKEIDNIQGLSGAAVVYIDSELTIIELRKFSPICQISPVKVILREPLKGMNSSQFANHLKGSQGNIRESQLVVEIAGTVLSCGAMTLGWIVVVGSGVAIPLTGGTSSLLTYTAIAASAASTAQCINGGIRTANEIHAPENNDKLDSNEWYQHASTALDVISLAGAGVAGVASVKAFKLLQANSGKATIQLLNNMGRVERARLTKDILRLNHPSVSNSILKSMMRTGAFPKRYTGIQITHALKLQLKDAIGASMSFSGSALSGTVKGLAIAIHQELSE